MADRFLGLQYPLVKTTRGLLAQKKDVDQIKADLLQLLLTNPGERVMLPQYGTPLRELFFDPNDVALKNKAKKMIAESISTWEPRIALENIEVSNTIDVDSLNPNDTKDDYESILSIKISFFDPVDITEIQVLALQVPIA
jgi:phage baseplate assembly protein W